MPDQLRLLLERLEALTLRERAMFLLVLPLVLVIAGEMLVFAPARKLANETRAQAVQQQSELSGLNKVLDSQPAGSAPALGAEELLKQRDEMRAEIAAARDFTTAATQNIDWGTVVRATVSGTPGLNLTQLRTLPAEVVFSPLSTKPADRAAPKPASASTSAAAASSAAAAVSETIYRHRAELTVKGDIPSLVAYLRALQRLPSGLRWERVQLNAGAGQQASLQLTLYTLSTHAATPFN
jgi:hypothetical protein